MSERLAWHIVSDVDQTLTPGDYAPSSVQREGNEALDRLVAAIDEERAGGELVFFSTATGRTLRSHHQLEQKNDSFGAAVKRMDLLIGSVGAEMKRADSSRFATVKEWPGELLGWERGVIEELIGSSKNLGRISLQPEMAQSEHKVSFNVETSAKHDDFVHRVQRLLGSEGLAATVIFSGGAFLDILPRLANGDTVDKGRAILFGRRVLAKRDHLNPKQIRIVFAGDSENDTLGFVRVIKEAAGYGIVPGNAASQFKKWAKKEFSESTLYVADAAHAAGVHEGLEHFGVLSGHK